MNEPNTISAAEREAVKKLNETALQDCLTRRNRMLAISLALIAVVVVASFLQWWNTVFFSGLIASIFVVQTYDAQGQLQYTRRSPRKALWARLSLLSKPTQAVDSPKQR